MTRAGWVKGLAGVFVAGSLAASSAFAVTIELKDVASDRIERQRAAAEGALPLPGTPDLSSFKDRLKLKEVAPGAEVFIRIFKSESELELWMRKGERFVLFATYPICHWSGTLGPKLREGDKQTPEGFYTVTRRQLHRIGRHPRSLNLGFPNALDKAADRTGSYILVHGGCSSVGCFAMTNTVIEEIYDLTEAALRQGQAHVPVHIFPFRMTEMNLAQHRDSPWRNFWLDLKQGYDAFERSQRPPRISVCKGNYQIWPEKAEPVLQSTRRITSLDAAVSQACMPGPVVAAATTPASTPLAAPTQLDVQPHPAQPASEPIEVLPQAAAAEPAPATAAGPVPPAASIQAPIPASRPAAPVPQRRSLAAKTKVGDQDDLTEPRSTSKVKQSRAGSKEKDKERLISSSPARDKSEMPFDPGKVFAKAE